ncbi:MAG TPA: hypothetical protein VEC12_10345 [Bacteroidia bacterium]|nr:hypothetical protein [Bacteroidia bacterium]
MKFGMKVEFKTSPLELGKKKITFKQTKTLRDDGHTITALLSFVSPIMQVIGTARNDSKEPLFNAKTNERVRFVPEQLIKCKYYNYNLNKFSEVLIPKEALIQVYEESDEKLKVIEDAIQKKLYIIATINDKSESTKTIIRPNQLIYRAGRYLLRNYDYKRTCEVEYLLEKLNVIETKEKVEIEVLPSFKIVKSKVQTSAPNKKNIDSLNTKYPKNLFWISYEDFNEEKTKRLIAIKKTIESDDLDENGHKYNYLIVHCYLRNDERLFRIDRIKRIAVINLVDDVTYPIKIGKVQSPA